VCDQPHPLLIRSIISECDVGDLDKALQQLGYLWGLGYSAVDIIGTMFRVLKTMSIQEFTKLEFIRVSIVKILVRAFHAILSVC
jgi:replication factor C subunit 2/4